MKHSLTIPVLILLGATAHAYPELGNAKLLASGKLKLSSEQAITEAAKGRSVLYVSLFDAKTRQGRPFASKRIKLGEGGVPASPLYKITSEDLMGIGSDVELPKEIHVKANLDADGYAGPEGPGDLVGWSKPAKPGATQIDIVINEKK